jgi:hypothetical protein
VDERGRSSSHDLEESVEELGSVVKVLSASVNLLDVTSDNRLLTLRTDDVLVDTVEKDELEGPPHKGASVPGLVGLGADHGLVLVGVLSLGLLSGTVASDLLAIASLKILAESSSTGSATLVKLLAGKVTLVEVADDTLEVVGSRGNRSTTKEEGTLDDVPGLELPVLLDDDTVQPRDKEDGHEKTPTSTSSNDDTRDLLLSELDLVRTTLPEKKHYNEGGSEPEVEGDKDKTLDGRALSEEDGVFCEEEDAGSEDTREHRGDDPSKEDL